MSHPLQMLIDAPLANATRINLPMGRRPAPRAPKQKSEPRPGDLTQQQVRERKAKEVSAKQEKLLDYYATTEVPPERVAEHVGLYCQVQKGETKDGKPIFARVLDVQRAAAALAYRRSAK